MSRKWQTISETEPDDCYIQHQFLFMGPFLPDDFYELWAEVISWNPRGHCTKMLCKSGFTDKGVLVYFMVILYSNPKFKEHMIRTAKHYSHGELKWFSGKHRFEMQVDDGEYFKPISFKEAMTEEEIESSRRRIQDSQENHPGWPKSRRELVDDKIKKQDDKTSNIVKFFGRYL